MTENPDDGTRDAVPSRNAVTIVASPRPRVGKTLLARLLVDFQVDEGRPVVGFDLNTGEGTLAQFLPAHARAVTLADVQGQMALFDGLIATDGVSKVVDLGRESFETFFAIAEQIDFAAEARRRTIPLAVLFPMTADRTSADAYVRLRARFPSVSVVTIQNEWLGRAPAAPYPARGTATLRFPALAPGLGQYAATPPFSFGDAALANASSIPPEARIALARWARRVYREFRELDLRTLLSDLQSSLALSR
jgi:hypothetical protein